MTQFARAARLEDLWPGEMKGLVVEGRKVLLVNLDGTVRAYENRCAHQGVSLDEGRLREGVLECPAHHWEYDLRSGLGVNPASARLRIARTARLPPRTPTRTSAFSRDRHRSPSPNPAPM